MTASSHNSLSTRARLEDHPRIRHAFIPVGACWLNLQEGWWRIFRKASLAGQSFASPDEITQATRLAKPPSSTHVPTLDLRQTTPANPPAPTPICVPPLRNPALGSVRAIMSGAR